MSVFNTLRLTPYNQYLAEFIGTFFLVLFGCGAMVVNDTFGVPGHGGVAAAFGLIVMIMIYAIGNISGAHMNPAVTIAFAVARGFDKRRVLPFIASQIIGAVFATAALKTIFPTHELLGATQAHVGILPGFLVEFLLSFLLMFVILNVTTGHQEKGIMAGVAIGATVGLEALVGGPLTNASMNPARSIGPALVSGHLDALWLFILAPILGTVAATPFCALIQGPGCCDDSASADSSAS